jgi:hypothetical protein
MGTRGLNPDAHHTAITFEETGAHSNGSGTASLDVLRSKARAQERRIEELERKLAATEGNDNPSFYRDSRPAEPEIKEQMMFRGKGFKTQFHGSTSVMSTIAQVRLTTRNHMCANCIQFRELQAFTREALTIDHSIMRIKTGTITHQTCIKAVANSFQISKCFGIAERLPTSTWEIAYGALMMRSLQCSPTA